MRHKQWETTDYSTGIIVGIIIVILMLLFSCKSETPNRNKVNTKADSIMTKKMPSKPVLLTPEKTLPKSDTSTQVITKTPQKASTDVIVYKGTIKGVKFRNGTADVLYNCIVYQALNMEEMIRVYSTSECTNRHIQNLIFCAEKNKFKYLDISLVNIKRTTICD